MEKKLRLHYGRISKASSVCYLHIYGSSEKLDYLNFFRDLKSPKSDYTVIWSYKGNCFVSELIRSDIVILASTNCENIQDVLGILFEGYCTTTQSTQ